jgi:hypothetical protein
LAGAVLEYRRSGFGRFITDETAAPREMPERQVAEHFLILMCCGSTSEQSASYRLKGMFV